MNFYFVIAAIACFMIAPAQMGSPCPSAAKILPCKCSKSGYDTVISCAYHDPQLLKIAFDSISADRAIVDFFKVSSIKLNAIGAKFFENVTVRSAMFHGDRWSSIDENAFVGQENTLARLTIQESLLTSVPIASIKNLNALEFFKMMNSEITVVADNAFDTLKSAATLKILDLRRNYIRHIGKGAFSKLTALKVLYLSNNKITKLESGTLPAMNSINLLNLGFNRLETIPEDIKTVSENAVINLGNNTIDIVSGVQLRFMITKKLVVLLNDNPLKCTCSMKILSLIPNHKVDGQCKDPTSGIQKSLKSLNASDFQDCFY